METEQTFEQTYETWRTYFLAQEDARRAFADLHNSMTKLERQELQALRDQIRFRGAI